MGIFVDKTHTKDAIAASLEDVRTEPNRPCPDCGAETRPHGEAPREDGTERICSKPACKEIQPAMAEVPRIAVGDERPRFPCRACARETKVFKSGRSGASTKRVCVRPSCRKITETAS